MVEKGTDKNITSKELIEPMDFLFRVGIVLLVLIAVLCIVVRNESLIGLFNLIPECVFHKITGYNCPGCGMTRASIALLNFHFMESIKYNIVIVYGFVCYVIFMVVQGAHVCFKTNSFNEKILGIFIYIGVAILIIQWAVKIVLKIV